MPVLPFDFHAGSCGQMDLDGFGIGGGHAIFRLPQKNVVSGRLLVVGRWPNFARVCSALSAILDGKGFAIGQNRQNSLKSIVSKRISEFIRSSHGTSLRDMRQGAAI